MFDLIRHRAQIFLILSGNGNRLCSVFSFPALLYDQCQRLYNLSLLEKSCRSASSFRPARLSLGKKDHRKENGPLKALTGKRIRQHCWHLHMQLPEFYRCHPGKLFKHHDKMAGIRVTDIMSDLLDFSFMFHDKKLLGPVDAVTGQLLIDRTVKITHKKS